MYILHYMDDILISGKDGERVLLGFAIMKTALREYGLEIAPEKVQQHDPYQY